PYTRLFRPLRREREGHRRRGGEQDDLTSLHLLQDVRLRSVGQGTDRPFEPDAIRDALAGPAVTGDQAELDSRVLGEDAGRLDTRVSGSAHDADWNGMHSRAYPYTRAGLAERAFRGCLLPKRRSGLSWRGFAACSEPSDPVFPPQAVQQRAGRPVHDPEDLHEPLLTAVVGIGHVTVPRLGIILPEAADALAQRGVGDEGTGIAEVLPVHHQDLP